MRIKIKFLKEGIKREPGSGYDEKDSWQIKHEEELRKQEEELNKPTIENFFNAIERGNERRWRAILKADPSLVNARDPNKQRVNYNSDIPVVIAARNNQYTLLLDLIEAGADIDVTYKKWTPLMWAAKYNNIEAARVLLGYSASLEINDGPPHYSTASDIAGHLQNEEIIFLIQQKRKENAASVSRKRDSFRLIKK